MMSEIKVCVVPLYRYQHSISLRRVFQKRQQDINEIKIKFHLEKCSRICCFHYCEAVNTMRRIINQLKIVSNISDLLISV